MGLLTKIEEKLSQNIGIALLASTFFAPTLRSAFASGVNDGVVAEPSENAISLNAESLSTPILRPVSVIRGDQELSEVWNPRVGVYVDGQVIDQGINPQVFTHLAEQIQIKHPNWSIYITSPQVSASNQRSDNNDSISARIAALAESELFNSERFIQSHDPRTGEENASVLVIYYNQNTLPTIASAAFPGASYQQFNITPEYWQQYLAPSLARDIAQNGDIEQPILEALSGIEQAFNLRFAANQSEQIAHTNALGEELAQNRLQVEKSFETLAKQLGDTVDGFREQMLEPQREIFHHRFEQAENALQGGDFAVVNSEINQINILRRELELRAAGVPGAIQQIELLRATIAEKETSWYLDDLGHQALSSAQTTLEKLEQNTYSLQCDPLGVKAMVGDAAQVLSEAISNDQAGETVGIMLSVLGGGATLLLGGAAALQIIPEAIERQRQKHHQARQHKELEKKERQQTETEIAAALGSLVEKGRGLQDFLFHEPITPNEEERDKNTKPDLQQTVARAWWVLKKMNSIVADAQEIASPAGGREHKKASALLRWAPTIIEEDDGLSFLPSVKKWREDVALADPLTFEPPTTNFQELSKELTALIKRARALDQRE